MIDRDYHEHQIALAEKEERKKRDLENYWRSSHDPEVMQMALCEQERVILRPNILYRFVVHPGCPKCARVAEIAEPPSC